MALPPPLLAILFTFSVYSCLISFMPTKTEAQETGIQSLVSEKLFKKVFPNIDSLSCPAKGFYSYASFIDAAKRFPEFGTTGSDKMRKREIAAFLAQISHQSAGGNANSTGPYTWGLCVKEQEDDELLGDFCSYSFNYHWDCTAMGTYKGRGPMMIKWNFNYGPAGMDLGLEYNLTWYPEMLLSSSKLAFQTALWVWMTGRESYPSPHDIMVGNYKPTTADLAANRTIGYGLTTNVIGMSTDGYECGKPRDRLARNRISYFKRIAALFNVNTGPHLDCANQKQLQLTPHEFPPVAPSPFYESPPDSATSPVYEFPPVAEPSPDHESPRVAAPSPCYEFPIDVPSPFYESPPDSASSPDYEFPPAAAPSPFYDYPSDSAPTPFYDYPPFHNYPPDSTPTPFYEFPPGAAPSPFQEWYP